MSWAFSGNLPAGFPAKSIFRQCCGPCGGFVKKNPLALEKNGELVTIRKVSDHGCEAFRIEYSVAAQRRMKTRADEREAHTDAKRIMAMLNERAPVFSQTEDATIYRAAKNALGLVNVPVDVGATSGSDEEK